MTDLRKILETLEAAAARRRYRKLDFYEPYPKQMQFHNLGATKRERLLIAGNQLGKTEAGAAEAAYHLTGDYPDWWEGRRWTRPVKGWAIGETSLLTRDVSQKKLLGPPGIVDMVGTGYIPKESIVDISLARGVTDAIDGLQVRHKSGGTSLVNFKSYEQGRQKLQGDSIDFGWCDEEPPMAEYSEILTRTTATGGMVYVTFTPLQGRSDVVNRYLDEPDSTRAVVTMTIYDAKHIAKDKVQEIINSYPAHERQARAMGVPMLGSGRIFPYADDLVSEARITEVPIYWKKLWGIDFGIDHPFAAVLIAWDVDADVIHVLNTHRVEGQLPIMHAPVMKNIAGLAPVAWPQDGHQRDKGSGEALKDSYAKQGLKMLPEHAQWLEGGNSTEAGILEMQERMTTGRLKVASDLADFFEEFKLYHRKDGQIVKLKDDVLSALRVAIMDKRHARPVALGPVGRGFKGAPKIAKDVDFDLG